MFYSRSDPEPAFLICVYRYKYKFHKPINTRYCCSQLCISIVSGGAESSALRASSGMTSRVSFGTLRKGTWEAVRAADCNDMSQSAAYQR